MRVIERFREVAQENSDRVAVVDSEGERTYGELLGAVENRVAENFAVTNGYIIVQPRSVAWVVELLACWTCGIAPLLLDPSIPPQRLREVREIWEEARKEDPEAAACDRSLAYGVSTSGSSGVPKIVEVTHAGLADVLLQQVAAFELGPGKRALWILSPGFDASLSDVGTALLSGATLVCGPPNAANDLVDVMRYHRITHCDIPPSLLALFRPEDFPDTMETLVVGGAPSSPELLRSWAQRFRVFAVYGPTEATICSSLSRVDQRWDSTYIGRPLDSLVYRIEDGELWISGPGLARGYAMDLDATSQAFPTERGRRWYRTGDMVSPSESAHGMIFVGRKDRQIQRYGQRLELDEIERRLWPLMGSQKVAVVAGTTQIWVFWEGAIAAQAARDALEQTLPTGWIPRRWERLQALPRTANGKLDREELTRLAQIGDENGDVDRPEDLDSLAQVARQLQRERAGGRPTTFHVSGQSEARSVAQLIDISDALTQRSESARGLRRDLVVRPGSLRPGERPTMLLTGATGGLGRALTQRLSQNFRLLSVQRRDSGSQGGVEEVLVGDLRAPRFGLSPGAWSELKDRTDIGFHLAAVLSSNAPFEEHLAVNVRPLLALSELTTTLHLASSLSVSLSLDPRPQRLTMKSLGSQDTVVVGSYAQSKWIAERVWRQLAKRGICLRYGQLLGAPSPTHLLTLTARGLVELGCYPYDLATSLWMDLTPTDFAVERTLVALRSELEAPEHRGKVEFVSSEVRVSLQDLVDALDAVGWRLRPVNSDDFFTQCLGELSANAAIAQKAISPNGLFLMSGIEATRRPKAALVNSVRRQLRDYLRAATVAVVVKPR